MSGDNQQVESPWQDSPLLDLGEETAVFFYALAVPDTRYTAMGKGGFPAFVVKFLYPLRGGAQKKMCVWAR